MKRRENVICYSGILAGYFEIPQGHDEGLHENAYEQRKQAYP